MLKRLSVIILIFSFILAVGCAKESEITKTDYQESPFGVTGDSASAEQVITYSKDIGVKSVRLAGPSGIIWDIVKKQGWTNDALYKKFNDNDLELSVVVICGNPAANNTLNEYSEFLKSAVKRYPYIAYLEIDNEPDLLEPSENTAWKGEISETKDYALVLKTAYEAIKSENPNAKVAIAGMAFDIEYYEAILKELEKLKENSNDKFFDAFNYHHYGTYNDYLNKPQYMPSGETAAALSEVISLLNKYGYDDTKIIVTETATYSGLPAITLGEFLEQTERQQAVSLVKRYVYPLSTGRVSRTYWFKAFSQQSDSRRIIGKLAYYSYKLLVEELEGSDFESIENVYSSGGVYAYKFTKNGNPVWIAWNDNAESKNIVLDIGNVKKAKVTEAVPKYDSGADITSYSESFNSRTESTPNGKITLSLADIPIYIEDAEHATVLSSATLVSQSQAQQTQKPAQQPQGNQTQQKPETDCVQACIATGKQPQACLPQCLCGDGTCDSLEKQKGSCPADCG